MGRQPFTIYGLLRTAQSAAPLDAPAVAASLIAFVVVYFAVFGAGIFYLLKLMSQPPQPHESLPSGGLDGTIKPAAVDALIEGLT